MSPKLIDVGLSSYAITRLAGLCDARVHHLRKFIAENADKPSEEDDVSDCENEVTYLDGLATMLRGAREAQRAQWEKPDTTDRCEHGMSRGGLACDWCNPLPEPHGECEFDPDHLYHDRGGPSCTPEVRAQMVDGYYSSVSQRDDGLWYFTGRDGQTHGPFARECDAVEAERAQWKAP